MSFISRALSRPLAFTGGLIKGIALWRQLWHGSPKAKRQSLFGSINR